jgi:monoamine oxidase
MAMIEIAIVGGGLSGLALANTLSLAGCEVAVYEARPRLGGRILSAPLGDGGRGDLGPTWFWPAQQRRIAGLVAHLGLATTPQYEDGDHLWQGEAGAEPKAVAQPGVHAGAVRLAGGMDALTDALAARLPADAIRTEHVLTHVRDHGTHVALCFDTPAGTVTVSAATAVIALPPRLVDETLVFEPELPPLTRVAMRETPTWMATQAKLVAPQPSAFWRRAGRSGTAVAPYPGAVLAELWDACDPDGHAALAGFVGLDAAQRERFTGGLPMLAASHLVQFFGPEADPEHTQVQDWATERFTCSARDKVEPAEHPDSVGEALQRPFWQGRLHFGGSETAAYAPGYMEGALEAAGRIHKAIAAVLTQAA